MARSARLSATRTGLELRKGRNANPAKPVAAARGEPISLRDRKKSRQREELLKAATVLFREHGIDGTRMEDIALAATVSTKTVYNYFPSKREILVALLRADRAVLQPSYERLLRRVPDDPAAAFASLMITDFGEVRTAGDKRFWRELLAASIRAHDRPDDEFESNRRNFTRCIEALLAVLIRNGVISDKIDRRAAADTIYAIHAFNFSRFCAYESLTPRAAYQTIYRQMRLVLVGLCDFDREPGAARPVSRTTGSG